MHAEGADEVAFEQPEGLSQQKRAGDFGGDAVDHLAPELMRHEGVELLLRHGILRARWDGAAGAGKGKPQALDVALGQDHGGVEADDREEAGDVQDGLDDVLADVGLGVVELRGVVPGEGGAVVAVIDVARLVGGVVAEAEGDGGVGLVVVVVVDLDLDARVGGEIWAVEAVGGEGALPAMDEPVGMLDDPGRVDAHVVGHHVAGEAQAGLGGAVLEVVVGEPAAEVLGDVVAFE